MATSVPNKNRNSRGSALVLTYSGKQPKARILTEPAHTTFKIIKNSNSLTRLFCGDNLSALKMLADDPTVRGKVTLVYIDPPFATKGAFLSRKQKKAYDDDLSGAEYVESLRQRLSYCMSFLRQERYICTSMKTWFSR